MANGLWIMSGLVVMHCCIIYNLTFKLAVVSLLRLMVQHLTMSVLNIMMASHGHCYNKNVYTLSAF